MASASEALAAAAHVALAAVSGLNGAYDGVPVNASLPYATVEIGPESDWSWKDGEGREIRLAATIRDAGEQPARLRRLMAEAEAALIALGDASDGWRIVNVMPVRARTAQKRAAEWTGTIEVRVRMERES
jgi:hypothetical protein